MLLIRKENVRGGFTLVELVIVVGILALLMGILIPVLGNVQRTANIASSKAQLRNLSIAITDYHTTFKAYPGYFDEEKFEGGTDFTSTENLTLSLLGGAKIGTDTFRNRSNVPDMQNPKLEDYNIDIDDIGKGPKNSVSKRSYGAFYAAKPEEVAVVEGTKGDDNNMPELVDTVTGLPILYYRYKAGASNSSAVGDTFGVGNTNNFRVSANSNDDYLSDDLRTARGEDFAQNDFSLIHESNSYRNENLARIFRNGKLSKPISTHLVSGDNAANDGSGDIFTGGFALIAPGPDGIYFNSSQIERRAPGDEDDLELPAILYNAQDTLDDIVIIGGND